MFARAYDLLMSDVDYSKIYEFLEPYLKTNKTILDVGCGSGYLLLELLRNGHYALGVDNDSTMLSLANDKIKEAQLNPMLYEHDLRNQMHIKVDVILAMFDVVNYFKGAKGIFSNIYNSLNENGVFIFDIYKTNVLKDYNDFLETSQTPVFYEWRIKTTNNQMNHLLKVENEVQVVKQHIYKLDYYKNVLVNLGFKVDVKSGPDKRKHYLIAIK